MGKVRRGTASARLLAACAVTGGVVLGGQLVGWATSGCQVPNPNTKLCAEVPDDAVSSCDSANPNEGEGCGVTMYETNNFPDGPDDADSGTTGEEQADCQRSQSCKIDNSVNPARCVVSGNGWSSYSQEAKTVTGTGTCPTTEG